MLLTNDRSFFNKLDEIRLLKSTFEPTIIAITESWLHMIDSSLLAIANYVLFRDDRATRKGGSVCLWCQKRFYPAVISTKPIPQIEYLFIYLNVIDCHLVLVYCNIFLRPFLLSIILSSIII